MKLEEVPKELVDLLAANVICLHVEDPRTRQTVALILTRWEELRHAQIRRDNRTSMYQEMVDGLGARMVPVFAAELRRHEVRYPGDLVTCTCARWSVFGDSDTAWGTPFREHVADALVQVLRDNNWLPVLAHHEQDTAETPSPVEELLTEAEALLALTPVAGERADQVQARAARASWLLLQAQVAILRRQLA